VSSLDPGWVRSETSLDAPTDPRAIVLRVLDLASLPKGSPNGKKWKA
jgi:hypothetical protein